VMSVSVCLSAGDHIFGSTCPIFTKFVMRITHGLLWLRCDTLRISGFVDDVIFAYKVGLLDIATRLRP